MSVNFIFILNPKNDFAKKCIISEDFKERIGLDEKSFKKAGLAKFDKDTGVVHFFPTKSFSKNYTKYIKNSENYKYDEKEIIEIVKKYTTHESWYCTKINLLLASDSDDMKDQCDYIKQLIWCIKKLASIYPILETRVFRGNQCSLEEYNAYKLNENLYIPSFLSSSKNPKKFYQAESHNTLMVINLKYIPNNAFVVNAKYSIYSEEEEEVLFGCYSKFRVIKKMKNYCFNKKNYEFYIELEHINEPIKEMNENLKKMICYNFFQSSNLAYL